MLIVSSDALFLSVIWRGKYGELRAFQSYDGRELWKATLTPGFCPGVGDGRVYWFAVALAPAGEHDDDPLAVVKQRFACWGVPVAILLDATDGAGVLRTDIHDREPVTKWGDGFKNHPVGTGPFAFESWTVGEQVVVRRNDRYWGDKPQLARIVFRVVVDARQRLVDLESGSVDIATAILPDSSGSRAAIASAKRRCDSTLMSRFPKRRIAASAPSSMSSRSRARMSVMAWRR